MTITGTKSHRRIQRRINSGVSRMSHDMTCFIAMWPELGPRSCKELNKPWRALKKIMAKRIEARRWDVRLDLCTTAYHAAQNSAASAEEHERIHKAALAVFPEFPRLLNSLYRNYVS